MAGDGGRPDVPFDNGSRGDYESSDQEAYGQFFQQAWEQQQSGQGQGQVWQRSDGGRYFDQPQGDQNLQRPSFRVEAPSQQRDTGVADTPLGNGLSIRQYQHNPRVVDIVDTNTGRVVGREPLDSGGQFSEIPIRHPNNRNQILEGVKIYANGTMERMNPQTGAVFERINTNGARDHFDEKGKIQERVYPDGVKETFRGGQFPAQRDYPDGSYEKFDSDGKVQETKLNGFKTTYDAEGRKTNIDGPNGESWRFNYAGAKLDSYTIGKGATVLEQGSVKPDGTLKIERRQEDGSLKTDESLKDRVSVSLRADLSLDYLDKDGFSSPDEHGRKFKRDSRTVMAARELPDGRIEQVPINPIRSVKMPDGRTIDYDYNSDGTKASGMGDDIKSYTIRNAKGEIVEFGARVPQVDAMQTQRGMWLEYRAKPGQPPMDERKVNEIKGLLSPGSPQEMIERQRRLVQDKPLNEYTPKQQGSETSKVLLDQANGRLISVYGNGDSMVRDERGVETIYTQLGDKITRMPNGREVRVAWDANPKISGDRTTVTEPARDGTMRVLFHHSRADGSKLAFGYDAQNGINEVMVETDKGVQARLVKQEGQANKWVEQRLVTTDGKPSWQPNGKTFDMTMEMANADSAVRLANRPLPPGTVIWTDLKDGQPSVRRFITPSGTEIVGRVTNGDETLPWMTYETPNKNNETPGTNGNPVNDPRTWRDQRDPRYNDDRPTGRVPIRR